MARIFARKRVCLRGGIEQNAPFRLSVAGINQTQNLNNTHRRKDTGPSPQMHFTHDLAAQGVF